MISSEKDPSQLPELVSQLQTLHPEFKEGEVLVFRDSSAIPLASTDVLEQDSYTYTFIPKVTHESTISYYTLSHASGHQIQIPLQDAPTVVTLIPVLFAKLGKEPHTAVVSVFQEGQKTPLDVNKPLAEGQTYDFTIEDVHDIPTLVKLIVQQLRERVHKANVYCDQNKQALVDKGDQENFDCTYIKNFSHIIGSLSEKGDNLRIRLEKNSSVFTISHHRYPSFGCTIEILSDNHPEKRNGKNYAMYSSIWKTSLEKKGFEEFCDWKYGKDELGFEVGSKDAPLYSTATPELQELFHKILEALLLYRPQSPYADLEANQVGRSSLTMFEFAKSNIKMSNFLKYLETDTTEVSSGL